MSNNLLAKKIHFQKLFEQDTPFIQKFGTESQQEEWNKGEIDMKSAKSHAVLQKITEQLGRIRDVVHTSNENNTDYRLFYLQKGPQTYDEIRRALGKEIADAVHALRNM